MGIVSTDTGREGGRPSSKPAAPSESDHACPSQNDRELLEHFRAGDPVALTRIYWSHVARVERLIQLGPSLRDGVAVRGAGGSPDLADMVQDVFIKAFSAAGREGFDGLRSYCNYLLTIARNVLIDRFRREGTVRSGIKGVALDLALAAAERQDEEPPWTDPARVAVVQTYLAGLSPELRAFHHQRYGLDVSQEAAAAALGLTRQRVRTLEKRLRSGLARALAKAGLRR